MTINIKLNPSKDTTYIFKYTYKHISYMELNDLFAVANNYVENTKRKKNNTTKKRTSNVKTKQFEITVKPMIVIV